MQHLSLQTHQVMINLQTALINRAVSIKCIGLPNSAELYNIFKKRGNVPLHKFDSPETPIFRKGLIIKSGQLVAEEVQPKPLKNPFDVMMGSGTPQAAKFVDPPTLQSDSRLDVQLKSKVFEYLLNDVKLGYYSPQQKELLERNVGKIVSTLCMLEKHWSRFFQNIFPQLPSKYSDYELVTLVTQCRRNSSSKSPDRLKLPLVVTHLTTLSNLRWSAYGLKSMKAPLAKLKEQISHVCTILNEKKSVMIGHNAQVSPLAKPVSSIIKSLPSYIQLDEERQEFYACVPPLTKRKQSPGGKSSTKQQCIRQAITRLTDMLRYSEDYSVIHLNDEEMGIVEEAFTKEGGRLSQCAFIVERPGVKTFYISSLNWKHITNQKAGNAIQSVLIVLKMVRKSLHIQNLRQMSYKKERRLLPRRRMLQAKGQRTTESCEQYDIH